MPQPMVARVIVPATGVETSYLHDPEVDLPLGGLATLEGTWTPSTPFTLALTGVPPDATIVPLQLTRFVGGRSLFSTFDNAWVGKGGVVNASFPHAAIGDGTLDRTRTMAWSSRWSSRTHRGSRTCGR